MQGRPPFHISYELEYSDEERAEFYEVLISFAYDIETPTYFSLLFEKNAFLAHYFVTRGKYVENNVHQLSLRTHNVVGAVTTNSRPKIMEKIGLPLRFYSGLSSYMFLDLDQISFSFAEVTSPFEEDEEVLRAELSAKIRSIAIP